MPRTKGSKNKGGDKAKKSAPGAKKSRLVKNEAENREPRKTKELGRLRGMRDILSDEYQYWDVAIKKARELARIYGFDRIETPVLERQELYEKSTGRETDIVSKEMYNFVDRNGDKVALRPEATPSLVRAYIEHGMLNLPQPVNMYWIGSIFRHEKPQAGRFRQAHQFDMEIFGEAKPMADALLILVGYNFFKELQIPTQVQINSIGCAECRGEYIKKLQAYYNERGKKNKMCADCKKRIKKNPLRVLDCKEPECVVLRENAPQIIDSLCDNCRNHFVKVLEYLDEMEIPYNLNPQLVRGLDYYTRTVFEFWPEEGDESRQMSLGGGGRYDYLIEQMGGRPTPACGFAIGLERAISKMKEKEISLNKEAKNIVFIAQLGDMAKRKSMKLFEEMRKWGLEVRQSFTKDSLKAQLEDANKLGARFALILGQKEVSEGTILIRDMESGIQEVIDYKKVREELNRRFNEDKQV